MDEGTELSALRAFVRAHTVRHPNTGDREPIMYLRYIGGSSVQHHALDSAPDGIDEALLEDMYAKGLISIDFREHNWNVTPTDLGRRVVEEADRTSNPEPVADLTEVVGAIEVQMEADNPLAWPVVRPVLAALRRYWQAGGYSQYGIQLFAVSSALPDNCVGLFGATIRALVDGEYLSQTGTLAGTITDDAGRVTSLPAEVALTEKAHKVLDGWPGAAPEEMVQNLLAVIASQAADEPDPSRKRRLERLADSIRELGVGVTSEVIAKVLTGGIGLA